MGQNDRCHTNHSRSTEGDAMATDRRMFLSWDDVERLPELRRLEFVLDNLPDGDVCSASIRMRSRVASSKNVPLLGSGCLIKMLPNRS